MDCNSHLGRSSIGMPRENGTRPVQSAESSDFLSKTVHRVAFAKRIVLSATAIEIAQQVVENVTKVLPETELTELAERVGVPLRDLPFFASVCYSLLIPSVAAGCREFGFAVVCVQLPLFADFLF
jgi:hypothetical protein